MHPYIKARRDIVYSRIANGEIQELIEWLSEELKYFEQHLYEFTLLSGRWRYHRKSVITTGESEENAKYADLLMEFTKDWFRHLESEIYYEKLLIVVESGYAQQQMQTYLKARYFIPEHLSWHVAERDGSGVKSAAGYDFVLFDAYHCTDNRSYKIELLTQYLSADTTSVLLYFGLPDDTLDSTVEKYREKFYASNSPFSLYARIKELREYLKIHGAKPDVLEQA
jgi:hypothetical protein